MQSSNAAKNDFAGKSMGTLALTLLAACEAAYDAPQYTAGPDGRDAASYDPISCTLSFRGTLTDGLAAEADWINDFHADLISDPRFPGKVHAGFASSITDLWPFVSSLKPRYITGHSKGGALAMLAGWLFRELNPIVITFAAARPGNVAFARACKFPCFRFENPKDIVPRLPFWFSSPGCQVVAPASFSPPDGIRLNHSLDTGYKPWIK